MARLSCDGAHGLLPGERPAIRPRPISISAIPRPVSGTSRQVSSLLTTSLAHQSPSLASPDRVTSPRITTSSDCARHRPNFINDGMPPTSYSMPRAMLPRSDSQLPYKDRPEGDLSGVKEQFHIRKYSTQKLEDPSHSSRLTNTATLVDSSRKATSSVNHASSVRREITPRTLMRPIQASLPRSQTLAHLGCLPNVHDILPSRPVRKSDVGGRRMINSDPELDIMDALLESRMTKHEIESLDLVRTDTIKNQKRLSPHDSLPSPRPQQSVSFTASGVQDLSKPSTVTHPFTRPTKDLETLNSQDLKVTTKRPLYVNTILANTVRTYESSPMSYGTPGSGNTYSTVSSSAASPDPRNVYRVEDTAYWTGRYVAMTDHIRRSDCDVLLRSKKEGQVSYINSDAFERKFDQVEATRIIRVLEELRQFCKTPTALRSFNHFEAQFRKLVPFPNPGFVRSQSDILKINEAIHANRFEQEKVPGLKQSSGNIAMSPLSIFNTSAAMGKISGFIGRQGKLIKSNTTGNLASQAISYQQYTPGVIQKTTPAEGSELLQSGSTFKPRTREMEERTVRPQVSSTRISQLSDKVVPKLSAINEVRNQIIDSNTVKQTRDRQSTPRLMRAITTENTTASFSNPPSKHIMATEVNHSRFVPNTLEVPNRAVYDRIGYAEARALGQLVPKSTRTGERRSSGQRSGEFVKKVVGAGIREVRKVSRRVGSMGWASSSDELSGVNK